MNSETQAKEKQEKQFLAVFEHLTIIDKELANFVNNFNNGQGDLALLRFENSDIGQSISSVGFTYGPAYTTLKEENGKFSLVKNCKDLHFLEEDARIREELEFENNEGADFEGENDSFANFQERILKQNQQVKKEGSGDAGKLKREVESDEVLNRFGNLNNPPRLYAAKNSFNKALENIVLVANELRKIHSMK